MPTSTGVQNVYTFQARPHHKFQYIFTRCRLIETTVMMPCSRYRVERNECDDVMFCVAKASMGWWYHGRWYRLDFFRKVPINHHSKNFWLTSFLKSNWIYGNVRRGCPPSVPVGLLVLYQYADEPKLAYWYKANFIPILRQAKIREPEASRVHSVQPVQVMLLGWLEAFLMS